MLGADALSEEGGSYLPDFSAFIATPQVRCLQISRVAYAKAILKQDPAVLKWAGGGEDGSQGGVSRKRARPSP